MEQVTGVFDSPFQVEGNTIQVKASIGISLYPEHSIDGGELLAYAGHALAEAKSSAEAAYRIFNPDSKQ